jgi:hypothetical protein
VPEPDFGSVWQAHHQTYRQALSALRT